MTVRLRTEEPGDREVVRAVQRAAFGEEGPLICDLLDALAGTGASRAGIVADDDGGVAGHVLLSRGWLDAERELVEVLVLGPLGVAPERQGRGLGTALVAAAIARSAELGAPAVFLEGSPTYYGARGFSAAAPRGFGRPSDRIPGAAFQVALLPSYQPWMAGRLVYPEAFWALDCVGLRGETLAEARQRFGD